MTAVKAWLNIDAIAFATGRLGMEGILEQERSVEHHGAIMFLFSFLNRRSVVMKCENRRSQCCQRQTIDERSIFWDDRSE